MVRISCRALLIVFMQTSCSSHFGLCYSHPFDLWNAKSRLNTVDKRQGGPSQFCLCFLSKAAVGCYRRLSTEASALPNPKCANCASAKSAKARFEFLPVAPVLVSGLRGLAPSLIVRVSQQTERADDMSSSPIRSKVLSSCCIPPGRMFANCGRARYNGARMCKAMGRTCAKQWGAHVQSNGLRMCKAMACACAKQWRAHGDGCIYLQIQVHH